MRELATLFLRLGFLGFGGPIAVMGMLEEEACRRKRWLTSEEFASVYAVLKLMPGPFASMMVVYLGHRRAGVLGGIVSGVLFILPAFILVLALSWIYFGTGWVASAPLVMQGLQAGALVVILFSTWSLAKPFARKREAWFVALVGAVITVIAPRAEPLVILGAGLAAVGVGRLGWFQVVATGAAGASGVGLGVGGLTLLTTDLSRLAWTCFKAGAFVFGSGLAIVPMLESEVVQVYKWMSPAEFMDGLAIGQVTPGPVVITATFIGYKVAGLAGACVATFMIFAPAFFNVLVILPRLLRRLQGSEILRRFASWAIPAVVGCILGTMLLLGRSTLDEPFAAYVFVAACVVAYRFRLSSWLLILACGAIGVVAQLTQV